MVLKQRLVIFCVATGLAEVGVALSKEGEIVCGEGFQTSVPSIFAIGIKTVSSAQGSRPLEARAERERERQTETD